MIWDLFLGKISLTYTLPTVYYTSRKLNYEFIIAI